MVAARSHRKTEEAEGTNRRRAAEEAEGRKSPAPKACLRGKQRPAQEEAVRDDAHRMAAHARQLTRAEAATAGGTRQAAVDRSWATFHCG